MANVNPERLTLSELKRFRGILLVAFRVAVVGRHSNGFDRSTARESVLRLRQMDGLIELREDAAEVARVRAARRPARGEMFFAPLPAVRS